MPTASIFVRVALFVLVLPACAADEEPPPAADPQPAETEEELIGAEPLSEAAKVATLADACPASRTDPTCQALRAADARTGAQAAQQYDVARQWIAQRSRGEKREAFLADAAVRHYLRERSLSLLAWNALTKRGTATVDGTNYWKQVDALAKTWLPAYAPHTMPMARVLLPPKLNLPACSKPLEALLIFPGVIRLGPRQEFAQQIGALRQRFPCLEIARVDQGSFVHPQLNAQRAKQVVQQIDGKLGGAVPLHFLGYSQGSRNALQTLADFPDVAARVRSVVTLNSAARGSEVVDTLAVAIDLIDKKSSCAQFPKFAQPLCKAVVGLNPMPGPLVSTFLAHAMGVPKDTLQAFFKAEDAIAPAPSLAAFLKGHLPGVRSVGTADAALFWQKEAQKLPRTAAYLSFRSVISDSLANLPASNALNFVVLKLAGGVKPHSDMQVRAVNQQLGGPIAGVEAVGRLFEGNHWQWELAPGDVPETVMPNRMIAEVPRSELLLGHYEALHEAGLFLTKP